MLINEDGYRIWLRFQKIDDAIRLSQYREMIEGVTVLGEGETYDVIRDELRFALPVMLDKKFLIGCTILPGNSLVARTVDSLKKIGVNSIKLEEIRPLTR